MTFLFLSVTYLHILRNSQVSIMTFETFSYSGRTDAWFSFAWTSLAKCHEQLTGFARICTS
jgi:hypothetical protein